MKTKTLDSQSMASDLAERFAREHHHHLRYHAPWKRWVLFEDGSWRLSSRLQEQQFAFLLSDQMFREAAMHRERGNHITSAMASKMGRYAGMVCGMRSILRLASRLPEMQAAPEHMEGLRHPRR